MLTNYDEKTGIFYGVIAQNSLNPEVVEDIFFGPNSEDMSYKEALASLFGEIDIAIEEKDLTEIYIISKDILNIYQKTLKGFTKDSWDKRRFDIIKDILRKFKNEEYQIIKDILEQEFNDHYECDEIEFLYDDGEYQIIRCLQSDLMILKSPYYTKQARGCSPCVPMAGDLDSINEKEGNKKVYCLDPSFYDEENKPKYQVYDVLTHGKVNL